MQSSERSYLVILCIIICQSHSLCVVTAFNTNLLLFLFHHNNKYFFPMVFYFHFSFSFEAFDCLLFLIKKIKHKKHRKTWNKESYKIYWWKLENLQVQMNGKFEKILQTFHRILTWECKLNVLFYCYLYYAKEDIWSIKNAAMYNHTF